MTILNAFPIETKTGDQLGSITLPFVDTDLALITRGALTFKRPISDLRAYMQVGVVPDARLVTAGAGMTGGGTLAGDRTFNVVAADASIVVNADSVGVGVLQTDAMHGVRGGGTQHAIATGAAHGFMSLSDFTKLASYTFTQAGSLVDFAALNLRSTFVPSNAADLVNKLYVDALFAANDAMLYKGAIDCSANPNYPAADAGHTYRVSVAGKIGGASGVVVKAGDMAICVVDGSAAGNQAAVGANWNVIEQNLDGAVIGPTSATDSYPALFDGATGKLIKAGTGPLGAAAYAAIGVGGVQAYDAELAALAGLASAADQVPYFTGSGTAALFATTSYGRGLVALANQAALTAALAAATTSLQGAQSAADKTKVDNGPGNVVAGTAIVADVASGTNTSADFAIVALTLPAAGLAAQMTFEVKAAGVFTKDATAAVLNFWIKDNGGTKRVNCAVDVSTTVRTGMPWKLEGSVTIRTTGAGGTMRMVLHAFDGLNNAVAQERALDVTPADVTINTTATHTLTCGMNWTSPDTGNSVTAILGNWEQVK